MQILEVNGLRKVYTTRFGGASARRSKTSISAWKTANTSPSWANPAPARPRS